MTDARMEEDSAQSSFASLHGSGPLGRRLRLIGVIAALLAGLLPITRAAAGASFSVSLLTSNPYNWTTSASGLVEVDMQVTNLGDSPDTIVVSSVDVPSGVANLGNITSPAPGLVLAPNTQGTLAAWIGGGLAAPAGPGISNGSYTFTLHLKSSLDTSFGQDVPFTINRTFPATAPSGTISGTITDGSVPGGQVPGATVYGIDPTTTVSPKRSTPVGGGSFNLSAPAGTYGLVADAPGYQSYLESGVGVSGGGTVQRTIQMLPGTVVPGSTTPAVTTTGGNPAFRGTSTPDLARTAFVPGFFTSSPGTSPGNLTVVDASGTTLWSRALPPESTPPQPTFSGSTSGDSSVDITANGSSVAVATNGGTVAVYDGDGNQRWSTSRAGDVNSSIPGPWGQGVIFGTAIKFSPDGTKVAAGSVTGHVYLFDVTSGNLLWDFHTAGEVRALSFTPDGTHLLAGSGDRYLYEISVADHSQTWRSPISFWPWHDIAVSADGSHIAAGSKDGVMRLFDSTGNQLFSKQLPDFVTGVGFSPDGQTVIVCDSESLIAYGLDGSQKWVRPDGDLGGEDSGFMTVSGRYIVVGLNQGFTNGGGIAVYDLSGSLVWKYQTPQGQAAVTLYNVHLADDGSTLIATGKQSSGGPNGTAIVMVFKGIFKPTFYFAEGYTGPGFGEQISLLMPNSNGTASIDYYTGSGHLPTVTVPLTAGKVTTENVNNDVTGVQEVSARITFSGPGVAERRITFNSGNWHGNTNTVGVSQPASEWDFAEGSTLPVFSEYITLQNPNPVAVTVDMTYFTEGGDHPTKTLTLPASSRTTVEVSQGDLSSNPACSPTGPSPNCGVGPNQEGVSARIKSRSLPIVAERPFYVDGFSFGSGNINDGHDAFGANSPASSWNFAEGTTLTGFNEYLTLQNPNLASANVTLRYLDTNGNVTSTSLAMGAQSRSTVQVFGSSQGVGVGVGGVSVQVNSDQPIVAERPMYMVHDFGSGPVSGAAVVVGSTLLGRLFGFSYASSGAGESDYLTIQNSNSIAATVTITYYPGGTPVTRTVNVGANSRHTVEVGSSNEGAGPGITSMGIVVRSDQPILVEKPTYSAGSADFGADDTVGDLTTSY